MDADRGYFLTAGEGFLPPLLRFGSALLFSPYALRAMLPERNLLYALNKTDSDGFDRLVSEHLEPALLDEAIDIVGSVPGLRIARNVKWEAGEIDMLVLDREAGVALQIQAKAALPPQGARMTRQIETHAIRAIEQLNSFNERPAEFRDQFCAQAFGVEVKPLQWYGAVLTRSCLGTARAWSRLGETAALNPVLLRGAVQQMVATPDATLADLPAIAMALLDEIVADTMSGWSIESISVFGSLLEIPSLDYDDSRLARKRQRIVGSPIRP